MTSPPENPAADTLPAAGDASETPSPPRDNAPDRIQLAIVALSAVFTGVVAFFTSSTEGLAPPDQNPVFFTALCAIIGLIVGGFMYFLREAGRIDRRIVLALAGVATLAGIVGFAVYERQYRVRVVKIELGAQTEYLTIANVLSDTGLTSLKALEAGGKTINGCDTRDEADGKITYACARKLPKDFYGDIMEEQIFDDEAMAFSRNRLLISYRFMAFALIAAMYLIVDEFLAGQIKPISRRRQEKMVRRAEQTKAEAHRITIGPSPPPKQTRSPATSPAPPKPSKPQEPGLED